jgi:archaeal preflagellin peptidase FlaK
VPSLDLLRLLLGSAFLFYASVLDLRTRRVPNPVWISFAGLASLLFVADFVVVRRIGWIHVAIALGIMALAYALWYFHLLAGGADAKAMMALGILLPMPIAWDWAAHELPAWTSPLPGALTVLSNSVLLFSLAPLLFLLRNVLRGHVHFPAMLLGYKLPLERAADNRSFVWIVDRMQEDGRRRQVLFPSRTSDEENQANIARLRQAGVATVWVTPKIPFMVPLFVGFVTAFLLGDLLFRAVQALVLGA